MKCGKVEYYTLKPSLRQYFGRKVNKSLKFDEYTDDKKVHQVLDNLTLTTYIKDERSIKLLINGEEKEVTTLEESKIVQHLPSGIILIWDENQGYIIPSYEMASLEEIEEDLIAMKQVYTGDENDSKRDENKDVQSN